MPAIYVNTDSKCATLRAVFSCNGGRFALQYGAYCNPKRHVLESKTGHIADYFVCFYYQNRDFRVSEPWFLTSQTCLFHLVALFRTHVFLYNIVYKIPERLAGSRIPFADTTAHTIIRCSARRRKVLSDTPLKTETQPDFQTATITRKHAPQLPNRHRYHIALTKPIAQSKTTLAQKAWKPH